jgi:tetratricopeptide (TPR) repeat protein
MKRMILTLALLLGSPAWAEQPGLGFGENDHLDALFAEMQSPSGEGAASAEREVQRIFSQSGSAAMDLLLARGLKAMDAKDYPMAVWHFSALIDHAPEFAEGYNARASAFFLMGKYGEAMADIEMALVLNPRHFGALAGMGVIQEELGHPENALKAYKAALALDPHSQDYIDAVKRVEDQLYMVQ